MHGWVGPPGFALREVWTPTRATIRRELLGLKPRQRVPKDTVIHQYFGISTDEAGRAERGRKRFAAVKHTVPVHPLIEMDWSCKDCVEYLRGKLLYETPKSSCVFCPYRWRHLKQTDPAGWDRAVIDFGILAPTTIDPMAVGECHGMCGV